MNPIYSKEFEKYIFEVYPQKPSFEFIHVHQVHGNHVSEDLSSSNDIKSDGIYSKNLKTPIAIKTADCLPIAIIGENGCALLHAGWRGVNQEIIKNQHIPEIAPKEIFVGPHICHNCFEVTSEFKEHFPKSSNFLQKNDKFTFNLFRELESQIKNQYPNTKLHNAEICTYEDSLFHSYRLDKTSNRNWNILRAKF